MKMGKTLRELRLKRNLGVFDVEIALNEKRTNENLVFIEAIEVADKVEKTVLKDYCAILKVPVEAVIMLSLEKSDIKEDKRALWKELEEPVKAMLKQLL